VSSLPRSARVVVIGAGIVGNSLACHLARLGWTGIVQLDKGPLPNPGGSTGHASNFIFPVDHSREMSALTLDSVRQYRPPQRRARAAARDRGGGRAADRDGPQRPAHLLLRGGRRDMWMQERAKPINEERVREAAATGAEILAVACPFCTVMLDDGVKSTGDDMRVADVATLLAEAVEPRTGQGE
jgi:glycine/D-amino acid oxidase-like deaminating enzyme